MNEDDWLGEWFQLVIVPRSATRDELAALLRALWTFPALDGPYPDRGVAVAEQRRLGASELQSRRDAYGIATLPNGRSVPCGSSVFTDGVAEVDFSIPVETFADDWYDDVQIARMLTDWLFSVAQHVFANAAFARAFIGETQTTNLLTDEEFLREQSLTATIVEPNVAGQLELRVGRWPPERT